MTTALFLIGACLLIAGVAVIYWPAALVVAGIIVAGFAVALEVNSGPAEPSTRN